MFLFSKEIIVLKQYRLENKFDIISEMQNNNERTEHLYFKKCMKSTKSEIVHINDENIDA